MKIRLILTFAVAAFATSLFMMGCGGGEGDDTGAQVAEEQNTGANTETKGSTETMTGQDAWASIAEKVGVSLDNLVKHESGLQWVVREEGEGGPPTKGQQISAHYTGYLLDGTKFDSSVDRGQPFSTAIGVGRVIQGWDIAFTDMLIGEKRVLFIPPELGYGSRGAGGLIPPGATLVFDVELIDIISQ